jgi:hypothetical protein
VVEYWATARGECEGGEVSDSEEEVSDARTKSMVVRKREEERSEIYGREQ